MADTITFTTVEKDYAGPGTVRIVGTYADVTHTSPGSLTTVAESPTENANWIRLHQLTDSALWCLRIGVGSVALYLTSWAKVAKALLPELASVPVVTADPSDDATAFAKGTLTALATTLPTDGQALVLGVAPGVKTYHFKDALGSANDILIDASGSTTAEKVAKTLDNVMAAVNGLAGEGTLYGTGTTAHTQLTADSTNTATTQGFTSKIVGVVGNTYTATTTWTDATFGVDVTTLIGGLAAADFTCTASSETTDLNLWYESTDDGATYATTPLDTTGIYDIGTRATGTLTASDTPHDGDIVTIEGQTYTFKTALTTSPATVAYEVLIGANAVEAMANLRKASNDSGTEGTHYGTGTVAHPLVESTATADTGGGTATLTAKARGGGTAGNSIVTTCYGTHLSWGAGTLGSGAASAAGEGGLRVTPTSTTPDGYMYKCVAVNMAGTDESDEATLTVT